MTRGSRAVGTQDWNGTRPAVTCVTMCCHLYCDVYTLFAYGCTGQGWLVVGSRVCASEQSGLSEGLLLGVSVGVWQPREVWLHKGKPDANARLARIPTGPIGGVAGEKHKDLPRARDCKPSAHTHR